MLIDKILELSQMGIITTFQEIDENTSTMGISVTDSTNNFRTYVKINTDMIPCLDDYYKEILFIDQLDQIKEIILKHRKSLIEKNRKGLGKVYVSKVEYNTRPDDINKTK